MECLLPELQQQILSYTSLVDVKSYFKALNREPSLQELKFIAKSRLIPTAASLDILRVYEEEMNINQRIYQCVVVNDIEAFKYLLPHFEGYHKVEAFLLRGSRPEIARIYITHEISQGRINGLSQYIAICHNDYEMFEHILSEDDNPFGFDYQEEDIFKYINNDEQMLKVVEILDRCADLEKSDWKYIRKVASKREYKKTFEYLEKREE